MSDAVSGSKSGHLFLRQEARAGNGGSSILTTSASPAGTAGHGGAAHAELTAVNPGRWRYRDRGRSEGGRAVGKEAAVPLVTEALPP